MQTLSTLTAQTPYESQIVQTRELILYCMNLAHTHTHTKKQHLTFPLNMYTPGQAEAVWHSGTVMCFLCAGLEWPAIPSLPPALGKYSGQAVANTLLTQW